MSEVRGQDTSSTLHMGSASAVSKIIGVCTKRSNVNLFNTMRLVTHISSSNPPIPGLYMKA